MNSNSPTHNSVYYGTEKITSSSNNTATMINSENNYWEIQIDDGKWTRDQTQVLINTWKQYKHVLLNSTSSSSENFKIWKVIATEVNKYSPPKSLQQCKKKFRNIRYICKTAIQNNQQNSSKKHYPLFYNDFVEILAEGERMKNCIKDDTPNVEIIHEQHHNEMSLDYTHGELPDASNNYKERTSPPSIYNEPHDQSRSYNEMKTDDRDNANKYVPISKSTADSSYDSPLSHDDMRQEDNSSASPVAATENNQEINLNDTKHGLDCNNNYASLEENHHRNSIIRKHRNIDVSIMGPGYPLPKRYRRMVDEPLSPVLNYRSPANLDYPPSMTPAYEGAKPSPPMSSHINSIFKETGCRDMSKFITSTSTTINYPRKQNETLFQPHNLPKADSPSQVVTTSTTKSDNSNDNNSSIHERFVVLQEKQMELFNEMLNRHEQFLLRLLQQQKDAAEEAQRRDREFMLKLVEMFMKHN